MNVSSVRLPQSFLRGLEADLRALCADARRRSPGVKDAAERVILLLKEADGLDSEANAADEAAAAFCAACDVPDLSAGSAAALAQTKVAMRAVSCLHKLLTHRALSSARLPEVLDALEKLGMNSVDDGITLKVLQAVLSLLTVRLYAYSLSEKELARAFSLLFMLRTCRSLSSSSTASTALSAISHMSAGHEDGVIEQTSKAAFRQVASDLFAAAADAAVLTAAKDGGATAVLPLESYPVEVRAAYHLFHDLCRTASGDPLIWLSDGRGEARVLAGMDLILALEVMDDGLASNIALFAAQPVFCDLLAAQLCPGLHKLLRTAEDKSTLKALLGLVVSLVRNYWRKLQPDSEALLNSLSIMSRVVPDKRQEPGESLEWSSIYAMESLRCIVRSVPNEKVPLIAFVKAFDLAGGSGRAVEGVVESALMGILLANTLILTSLPPSPVAGGMKPFANTITNSLECMVAISAGVFVEVAATVRAASENGDNVVVKALLTARTTSGLVPVMEKLIPLAFTQRRMARQMGARSGSALRALTTALVDIAIAADTSGMTSLYQESVAAVATASKRALEAVGSPADDRSPEDKAARICALYEGLFQIELDCGEHLGRSWLAVIDALEPLDDVLYNTATLPGESDTSQTVSYLSKLRTPLEGLFASTSRMPWPSCEDLMSAIIQCSRSSIAALSKKASSEESAKGDGSNEMRVFGIARAELAMLSAFKKTGHDARDMPFNIWQLLIGHLTAVCSDSPAAALRLTGLRSLTRIASGAVSSSSTPLIDHWKCVAPFSDLLTSSFADTRSGALGAVHSLLEGHGEQLQGAEAWSRVLSILRTASGVAGLEMRAETSPRPRELSANAASSISPKSPKKSPASLSNSMDIVSEGFRVVQLIAGDFLSCLAPESLPEWIAVLGLYGRQNEDVNVALTAIGLLWRTTDFFAKKSPSSADDVLWIQLFQELKRIGSDDRPEVRNCAVKTLTGTMIAHNLRLSARAWNGCVALALLPLLEEVMQGGSVPFAADENGNGNRGKADVQLLLHHSRDTPRKQWNETRVLALAGVAKVLRTAMPRLAVLRDNDARPLFHMLTDGGANGLWRKMLRSAGVAAASRDAEVALAGVSALLELLNAAGFAMEDRTSTVGATVGISSLAASASAPASLGGDGVHVKTAPSSMSWISGVLGGSNADAELSLSSMASTTTEGAEGNYATNAHNSDGAVVLWEEVWSALAESIQVGGETSHTSSYGNVGDGNTEASADLQIVDTRALVMLAKGLSAARESLPQKFTPRSSLKLVEVLMHLTLRPQSIGEHSTQSDTQEPSTELTDVQLTTLRAIEGLSFGTDVKSWIELVRRLLGVLESHVSLRRIDALAYRVLEVVSRLFEGHELPAAVKSSELCHAVIALGPIMLERSPDLSSSTSTASPVMTHDSKNDSELGKRPLWETATEAFVSAMRAGTRAGAGSTAEKSELWTPFVKVVSGFLYAHDRLAVQTGHGTGQEVRRREQAEKYDVMVAECVRDSLCYVSQTTGDEMKAELVELLARGAREGEKSGRVRYVRACQRCLFRVADERGVAAQPSLGRNSMAIGCAASVVETCGRALGQYVADEQRSGRCPLPAARRAEVVFLLRRLRKLQTFSEVTDHGGARRHLLTLYPRLTECVDIGDEAVRQLARELLDEAAPVASGAGVEVTHVK